MSGKYDTYIQGVAAQGTVPPVVVPKNKLASSGIGSTASLLSSTSSSPELLDSDFFAFEFGCGDWV